MIRYLLDTNVLSEPIRRDPNPGVLAKLAEFTGQYATAAPVLEELVFGVHRLPPSRRRDDLRRFLDDLMSSDMPILPYDVAAASWLGEERARLAASGTPLPIMDSLVAAVARVNDLVLVTRNTRDFERHTSLHVENWFR